MCRRVRIEKRPILKETGLNNDKNDRAHEEEELLIFA